MSEQNLNEHQQTPVTIYQTKPGKTVFDAIPSKIAFFTGLIAGVMTFATIGFVLMIIGGADLGKLSLSGGSVDGWGAKKPDTNTNANTNAPAPAGVSLDKMPPITKTDHVRGDLTKAKVVMVEYSDYECPFCKSFHSTINSVSESYGSDVAWVYRHYPLSFHQNAQKEAEAAECIYEQGGDKAFWAYTDKVFERTTSNGAGIALTALGPLAKEVGVNQAKFQACLDSGKYATMVQDQMAGGSAAGIDGTPGTILLTKDGRGDIITGAQSAATIKGKIDALLK